MLTLIPSSWREDPSAPGSSFYSMLLFLCSKRARALLRSQPRLHRSWRVCSGGEGARPAGAGVGGWGRGAPDPPPPPLGNPQQRPRESPRSPTRAMSLLICKFQLTRRRARAQTRSTCSAEEKESSSTTPGGHFLLIKVRIQAALKSLSDERGVGPGRGGGAERACEGGEPPPGAPLQHGDLLAAAVRKGGCSENPGAPRGAHYCRRHSEEPWARWGPGGRKPRGALDLQAS